MNYTNNFLSWCQSSKTYGQISLVHTQELLCPWWRWLTWGCSKKTKPMASVLWVTLDNKMSTEWQISNRQTWFLLYATHISGLKSSLTRPRINSFQTCMTFYLLWNTKEDILKKFSLVLLMSIQWKSIRSHVILDNTDFNDDDFLGWTIT